MEMYIVEVHETTKRFVEVEAESPRDAAKAVRASYVREHEDSWFEADLVRIKGDSGVTFDCGYYGR